MQDKILTFSELFKKSRLKSGFATLAEFGKKLADEGLIFEDSLFSRWQNGSRIPKDRETLLKILKVFINNSGINSLREVNSFLETAGQGPLTQLELHELTKSSKSFTKLLSPRKIIKFLIMTSKSKRILRLGWVRENVKEPESVAEHSFQLSVMAMVLADQLGLDKEKLIKMTLVRGLGEVVTGDMVVERGNIVDIKKKAEKEQKEREGIRKIFGKIGQANEYLEIFDEMITKDTLEAKVFWELDNLEMAMQALEYEKEQGKNLEEFFLFSSLQISNVIVKRILDNVLKNREKEYQAGLNKKLGYKVK